jgi:hypothetical protein
MNVTMLLVSSFPETKWSMMSPQFRKFLCGCLVCGSVNMQNILRYSNVILVGFILWEWG